MRQAFFDSCAGSVPKKEVGLRLARKVQMRLVSLRRGDVRPRPGEPASLEKIVAELDAVALRLRGSDGKFATKS